MNEIIEKISAADKEELRRAFNNLNEESFAIKVCNMAGGKMEGLLNRLPDKSKRLISSITEKSLMGAVTVAQATMKSDKVKASRGVHRFAGILSGAIGGAGGIAALSIELPVTTTIIIRSILDIARSHGFDISEREIQFSAIEVFAFGSDRKDDDGIETGYYAVRSALNPLIQEIIQGLAGKKLSQSLISRFVSVVAGRFGFTVSEKAAVQMIPILGALGGAIINNTFILHYQKLAQGHFTIKRLEAKYDPDQIKDFLLSLNESKI